MISFVRDPDFIIGYMEALRNRIFARYLSTEKVVAHQLRIGLSSDGVVLFWKSAILQLFQLINSIVEFEMLNDFSNPNVFLLEQHFQSFEACDQN